jgi:hypothetical protein
MAVLLNATFATDAEGFDAGSRIAAEGADFNTGHFQIPTNTTASKSFTAITSGIFRVDFWFRVTDTETDAGATKNTFFYLLPTAGAISSANSITAILLSRNTADGATSTLIGLQYRNNAGFVAWPQIHPINRGAWVKIGIVGNFTGDVFNIYFNDVLWLRSVAWANAAAADFSRVVILNGTAGPATDFDEIRVESAWVLPTESVMIDHDFTTGATGNISATSPTTQTRSINTQPWKIPDDQTTFGKFTLGSNGGAPDTTKQCVALQRCRPEGIFEGEFQSSVAGTIYFGIKFRVWAGLDTDSFFLVRILGGATNTMVLFQGGTSLQSAAFTPAANTTYSLKVEVRGRYIECYRKAAALDSGSYTLIYTHLVNSNATGGRGLLSEEHAGPFIATTAGLGATDNYARRFRFTGALPTTRVNPAIVACDQTSTSESPCSPIT